MNTKGLKVPNYLFYARGDWPDGDKIE